MTKNTNIAVLSQGLLSRNVARRYVLPQPLILLKCLTSLNMRTTS